jgi:uncharacterized protein (DUF4415 family)
MPKKDDRASRPDADNPEWTREDFRKAVPALAAVEKAFGRNAAEVLKRGRGRPRVAQPKVNQTLRLDTDVVDAFKSTGPGWQARINAALRKVMPVG